MALIKSGGIDYGYIEKRNCYIVGDFLCNFIDRFCALVFKMEDPWSHYLFIIYCNFLWWICVFFKKASVEKNNWPYGYIKFICVFSSICSVAIFMTFLYFTMGDIGFLPLKFMNLINNEDNFYSVFMQATYAFSGGGVSFILWCWVVAKHSKGKWPYTVAKLQLILVFFSTYSFAFVGDYMRFIH